MGKQIFNQNPKINKKNYLSQIQLVINYYLLILIIIIYYYHVLLLFMNSYNFTWVRLLPAPLPLPPPSWHWKWFALLFLYFCFCLSILLIWMRISSWQASWTGLYIWVVAPFWFYTLLYLTRCTFHLFILLPSPIITLEINFFI